MKEWFTDGEDALQSSSNLHRVLQIKKNIYGKFFSLKVVEICLFRSTENIESHEYL